MRKNILGLYKHNQESYKKVKAAYDSGEKVVGIIHATGTGKSVAINAIITSLLYKKHPAELKFVMVDPKMVEFAPYKPLLRHYLAATPDTEDENIVIVDCDKVVNTLNSLVIEMENRYKLLMDAGVRNLEDYNEKFVARRLNPEKLVADSLHHQFLPYIVIIIDEYGDFIMQAGKQVETPIARITQKARAVGMHMILATQRPSVNIVTGVIKANIPTRIALRTQSVIDSRTVLDGKGAEQLIGRGDSLYSGNANVTRVQCAFVDTPEVDAIVEHIEKQQRYFEPYQLPEYVPEGSEGEALAPGSVDLKRLDPMFADVARYVVTKQEGSTSRLQRAFEIGYNRAGKLSDQLEAAGIVGPNKGPKGRDVLIQSLDELDKKLEELGINYTPTSIITSQHVNGSYDGIKSIIYLDDLVTGWDEMEKTSNAIIAALLFFAVVLAVVIIISSIFAITDKNFPGSPRRSSRRGPTIEPRSIVPPITPVKIPLLS